MPRQTAIAATAVLASLLVLAVVLVLTQQQPLTFTSRSTKFFPLHAVELPETRKKHHHKQKHHDSDASGVETGWLPTVALRVSSATVKHKC